MSEGYQKPKPPLFQATPASIRRDAESLIEQSRKVQDEIIASVQPETATFSNTLLPLVLDENHRTKEFHILRFYQNVSADSHLRAASSEIEDLLNDFIIETDMHEGLYKLVAAVSRRNELLDPESQQYLEKLHRSYLRNGLALPQGIERDRFKSVKKRLAQISIEFQRNLNEENGGLWLTRDDLDGVPKDILAGFAKDEIDGCEQLHIIFKGSDVSHVLNYAKDWRTRRRVMIANANKVNQNVALLKEALILRDEAARMLGYPNHAAFRLEEKMIKLPETVNSFLEDLRSRLKVEGLSEIDTLKQIKKTDLELRGEPFDGHYYQWDHSYYHRLMLEQHFNLDQQKLAEYFPLSTTIRRMLEIFQELFGMRFVEITADISDTRSTAGHPEFVWHPDVQIFSTWDEKSGGFLGYLYLDLYTRTGKYGHCANFNLQPGFIDACGNRSYPSTALLCNFPRPTARKPTLLKHDEVWMLFHELGHGIHDLTSKTMYARHHGTQCVQDFCEAPSQMLENWCWDPKTLILLSQHYTSLSPIYLQVWKEEQKESKSKSDRPPAKIPWEMIEDLTRTKHVNNAIFYLRQLHVSIFDMTIHQPESHEDVKKINVSRTWNLLRKDVMSIEGPESQGYGDEWGHGEVTFPHLLGDYDAGYYGYLCSQVYSLDMYYSFFKHEPMNREEGNRYRRTILERGGSQDEIAILKEFLGREPSTDAFYKELGFIERA